MYSLVPIRPHPCLSLGLSTVLHPTSLIVMCPSLVFWLSFILLTASRGDKLGPDAEEKYCLSDACDRDIENDDDAIQIDEEGELADRGETHPSLFTRFKNGALGVVSGAANTVYNTVYKLSSDVLEDIANIVQTVFNETAYGLFADAGETILDTIYDPG